MRNEKAVAWLADSVDLVDEQGAPMDRTLLLEAEGSEEEAGVDGPEDEGASDQAVAEVEPADVEGADEGATVDEEG